MQTLERVSSYPEEFLKSVGERKFRNPDTGNEVVFVSLPEAEQKRVFDQWSHSQKGQAKPKSPKKPTFEAARKSVFDALKKNGWQLKEHLKTPQAEKRVGNTRVLLHFKPQALYVEIKGGDAADRDEGHHDPRSTWVDIRDVAGDADRWTRDELPKIVEHFTKVKMAAQGDRWEKMPKGWTPASREKFWDSLTSGAPKHKVTECIAKMDGKVDNPGAFCAALADRVTPGWRERRASGWLSHRVISKRFPVLARSMEKAGVRRVHASLVQRLLKRR